MLERIIRASIAHRWLVLLLVLALSGLGVWNYSRLPIDAIPDITNVQVQINTETTPARFPATACRKSLRSLRTAPTFTLPASRLPNACSRHLRNFRRA